MKRLNFGCGAEIWEGWDNIDIQESSKLTQSFDFNKFPYPIKEGTYDWIYSRNVLEHLEEPDKVMEELRRICKDQGTIEIIVPHYNNKGAFSSLQHKHFFNEVCFILLEKPLTVIDESNRFKIEKLELVPTWIGKLLVFEFLRKTLNLFVGSIYKEIYVKFEVQKG